MRTLDELTTRLQKVQPVRDPFEYINFAVQQEDSDRERRRDIDDSDKYIVKPVASQVT